MSNSLSLQHPINGRVAIIAGLRTPFARQATAFSELSALELGKMLIAQFIRQLPFEAKLIEQLVFGQVVQMPQAPNIAREIVLGTAMPIATDAYTVTRACATSFQALANVATSITSGEIEIGIAGGADSSSLLPIGLSRKFATTLLALSKEKTLGGKFKRLRQLGLKDLLPVPPAIAEYSTGLSMGQTAEQMAKTFAISRDEQDRFAYRSHQLAAKAWQQGKLDNLVMTAFARPYKQWLKKDNCIRDKVVFEAYGKLHPVFDKMHGSVSAANSSPLTDGAAAILLMSEKKAKALNLNPLGFVKSFAFSANQVDENMLLGPAFSIPLALDKAGIGLADCSFVEMHEAFSAQVLANVKMLSCDKFAKTKLNRAKAVGEIDIDKLNPLGGSIAYGHPFAATGARMVMQSLDELRRKKQQFVLNAACASGGLGAAMVLEANYD